MMIVGTLLLELRLPGNHSLKGKRQVVKSLIARLHNRYNVAAAEVDTNDRWQVATIGVACVSNSAPHAREILENVIGFVEADRLDLEVVDTVIEVEQAF
ncbi:MAG: DUF503 domain-containing protein [Dehalococcoidia bacterium]